MDLLLILIVILIVLLIWRGPSMLPQFGEALGKTIRGVRENLNDGSGDATTSDATDTKADDTKADDTKADDGKPDA